jgi:adenylate kinase family enzyme
LSRVNVVGCSGSGKSTFARTLAARLGTPYVEMDAVFWQPHWTQPSDEVFFERLGRALTADTWVLDGNYSRTAALKWKRVQTVIWLDYSRARTLLRSVRRALVRSVTREELWPGTGNRESFRRLFSRDSIVLFAVRAHRRVRTNYEAAMIDPTLMALQFIRLRTPREADLFLRRIAPRALSIEPTRDFV